MDAASDARAGGHREHEWVDRVLSGDATAFSEIYGQHFPRVVAFVQKRMANGADAEDLAQETFIQVMRSIHGFERRSSLLTWIFGIAHNVCCRHVRNASRRRAKLEIVSAASEASADSRMEPRLDAAEAFRRCMVALEERGRSEDREIFRLRYADNRSIPAIAAQTGRSNDSVRRSLRRTRSALAAGARGAA